MDVDAGIAHTLIERVLHFPAAHIVVDDAHLHAVPGAVDECVGDDVTELVIFKDEDVDMDMMLGETDGMEQGGEERIAGGVERHVVVFERQCHALVLEQQHQGTVRFGEAQVTLLNIFEHRPFRQLTQGALGDEALFACVLTEEDIKEDTYYWQGPEHKDPCHGLGGLPVVHDDLDHHQCIDDDVKGIKDPIEVFHVSSLLLLRYFIPMSLCVWRLRRQRG